MLDTRKIRDFTEPERLIALLNAEGVSYSPWTSADLNLVFSKLLGEHIGMVINQGNNLDKLADTARKIGFRESKKMLFLSNDNTNSFFLFEPLSPAKVKCCLGIIGDPSRVVAVYEMDLDESTKLFPVKFKVLSVNAPHFRSLLTLLKVDAKPDEYFTSIVFGAAIMYAYLLFVEVETVTISPGEKYKPKKYEGFKNTTKRPFTVVDITWSRETINKVPFGVVGHFRNQPVGEGRKERKLIYIDPFVKAGYTRKSGKDLHL